MLAKLYRQFDADPTLDVPAEGYGGWTTVDVPLDLERTALVVMHAWDVGSPATDPEWWRTVEYLPRSKDILENVFPPLLEWARKHMRVFHVVDGVTDYYTHLPGYRPLESTRSPIDLEHTIIGGETYQKLIAIRKANAYPGLHNEPGIKESLKRLDFAPQARPQGDEGIAENGDQLFALCKESGIDHLIYIGFAINWCLLMSSGGMIDMHKRGLICSTIEEAVTAVENAETAREQREKQQALWRVAVEFGFVFSIRNW